MTTINTIGNRAITKETPLYMLLLPDNIITPGFEEIIPKALGNKRIWAVRVKDHLEAFSDTLFNFGSSAYSTIKEEEISFVPTHRYSYYYRGGYVEVWPNDGRIAIHAEHPDKENVVLGLLKLFFIDRNNKVRYV